MKTLVQQFSIGLFFFSVISFAETVDLEQKEYRENVKVKKNTEVYFENKFGDINIQTWEKMEVDLVITVTVDHDKASKLEKLMESVDIKMDTDASDGGISFKTLIDNSIEDANEFAIDYEVRMPAGNPMEIKLEFGKLYVSDYAGSLEVNQRFGKIQAGDLTGDVKIEQSYGGGAIGNITKGALEISFANGSLELGTCGELELESKYSGMDIEYVENLDLDFSFGNLDIEKAKMIKGQISYSGFDLGQLENALEMKISFSGSFDIAEISESFTLLDLEAKYSSVDLEFDDGASYTIDVEVSYGNFKYLDSDYEFSREIIENTSKEYLGKKAGSSNPESKVKIESKFGRIKVRN